MVNLPQQRLVSWLGNEVAGLKEVMAQFKPLTFKRNELSKQRWRKMFICKTLGRARVDKLVIDYFLSLITPENVSTQSAARKYD